MKLAWLCYRDFGTADQTVEICFTEPDHRWPFNKIVPIVYAEIQE